MACAHSFPFTKVVTRVLSKSIWPVRSWTALTCVAKHGLSRVQNPEELFTLGICMQDQNVLYCLPVLYLVKPKMVLVQHFTCFCQARHMQGYCWLHR
jgi:hypothetical protein